MSVEWVELLPGAAVGRWLGGCMSVLVREENGNAAVPAATPAAAPAAVPAAAGEEEAEEHREEAHHCRHKEGGGGGGMHQNLPDQSGAA